MKTALVKINHKWVLCSNQNIENSYFVWKNEIHKWHSDIGYGIKTWTNFNPKDESSTIVNHSNVIGKIIAGIDSLPEIDFNGFEKKIDILDVGSLAKINAKKPIEGNKRQDLETETWINKSRQIGYVEGFGECIKKFEDYYHISDIINALKQFGENDSIKIKHLIFNLPSVLEWPEIIRVNIAFTLEKEYVDEQDTLGYDIIKPKIENGKIKITNIING